MLVRGPLGAHDFLWVKGPVSASQFCTYLLHTGHQSDLPKAQLGGFPPGSKGTLSFSPFEYLTLCWGIQRLSLVFKE